MEKTGENSSKKRPDDPVHSVFSNEDLLIEILLRLPILSLVLFKSVSKQWLSLIKSPDFTLLRLTRKLDPPSGLFLKFFSRVPNDCRFNYDFVPLDTRIPSASHFAFGHKAPPGGNLEILQSCNGLLLCHSKSCKKLFVYNPSINCMFKTIPEPSNVTFDPSSLVFGARMAFDPTKSPHYKVIFCEVTWDVVGYGVRIYFYSSETAVWISVCGDWLSFQSFMCFQDGVYWNDAIHWVNRRSNLHFKLDILNDCPVLTTFGTPLTSDGTDYHECKLVESRGCLLLLCRGNYDSKELYIYEMRNGCSEWLVKYIVNLDDITLPLPNGWSITSDVHCIVLGEKEADSFIVMNLSEKVVQYKIVSKTLRTLVNSGNSGSRSYLNSCFEYIASFANV